MDIVKQSEFKGKSKQQQKLSLPWVKNENELQSRIIVNSNKRKNGIAIYFRDYNDSLVIRDFFLASILLFIMKTLNSYINLLENAETQIKSNLPRFQ